METIFSYLLFAHGIVATMIAGMVLLNGGRKKQENIFFANLSIASAVWSIGFCFMFVQTNPDIAHILRCAGLFGMFTYLIYSIRLLEYFNDKDNTLIRLLSIYPYCGAALYPFFMQRENIRYIPTKGGMAYSLAPNVWNKIYVIYCVGCALVIFYFIISIMHNRHRKWIRMLGRNLLICEIIIGIGMIFDTIMPVFGFIAFPGSTITQFVGIMFMYRGLKFYRHNLVTLNNMSEYVYYSVEAPILIYDEQKLLKVANKSAVEFFGLPRKYSEFSLERLFEIKSDVLNSNEVLKRVETRCRINHTHCRLEINTIFDSYDEVMGFIIIIDDLTDKMNIIEELEDAKFRADEANKAKTTFLAKMSHEIRTPLNTVLGMNEMIARESRDAKIINYADQVRSASTTLLGIINDILDLSKLEIGKLKIVDEVYSLSETLRDIVNFVSMQGREKGLAFRTIIAPKMPTLLYGDQIRVKQIVTNVVNNAVKYTDKGGIVIRINFENIDSDSILLIFEVEDTGRGMKKEDMERFFAPFERLDEKKNRKIEGSGLGMNITKDLLNLMGGKMDVESTYGVGSKFTITIPQKLVSKEEAAKYEEEKRNSKEEEEGVSFIAPDVRIMLVDDVVANLMVMNELLKRTKMKIDFAKRGEDCISMYSKKKYDIIFLDHMMPGMDGIDTLRQLKSMEDNQNQGIPIIVMTANAVIGSREKYIEAGFTDYISKPVDYHILEDMILKYLPEDKYERVRVNE